MVKFYIYNLHLDLFKLFSAGEFRISEILTVDALKEKIVNAPIQPKPICDTLWYIYDWNTHMLSELAEPHLQNHSKYNSFLISRESGLAKLRAKKLPQDVNLVPRAGIRMLKENYDFVPIGAAEFRIDKIKFDEIFRGLHVYTSSLDFERKAHILSSWDRLRSKLESLPRMAHNLLPMKLSDLPVQVDVDHADQVTENDQEDYPELVGDLYPEVAVDGSIEDDVSLGMECCVYTREKSGRPWVGRVVEILENRKFKIHWFVRKTTRSRVFKALNNSDGSPSLSTVHYDTVMFWNVSEPQTRTSGSFALGAYWLKVIEREYAVIDSQ